MKDVLDERLIVTLVALQPKKEQLPGAHREYVPTSMGKCVACQGKCKSTCKGKIK